jgi:hypothetical protein
MSQVGKGKKLMPLPKTKDVAITPHKTINKELEDSNRMVNGSTADVICYFLHNLYLLPMR